jgi:hypothetical protein
MMHILQSLVLWPHLRFPKWDPQSASNPTTTPYPLYKLSVARITISKVLCV